MAGGLLNIAAVGNANLFLTGNPSRQNIGQYDIRLKATDLNGSIALQSFTLSIEVDNYPPQIKTTYGNLLSKTKIYAYEDRVNDFSKIISFELSLFVKSTFKVLTFKRPVIFSGFSFHTGILVNLDILIFFIISEISSDPSIE